MGTRGDLFVDQDIEQESRELMDECVRVRFEFYQTLSTQVPGRRETFTFDLSEADSQKAVPDM